MSNHRDHIEDIFGSERLLASIVINQLAIIRLIVRLRLTEELKADLDVIIEHMRENGIYIGDGFHLDVEEFLSLFGEIQSNVDAVKFTLDQWKESS